MSREHIIKQEIERFESDAPFNIFDVVKAYVVSHYSMGIMSCRLEDVDYNTKKLTLMSDGMVQFQATCRPDFHMMGSTFTVTVLGNRGVDQMPMSLHEIKELLFKNR